VALPGAQDLAVRFGHVLFAGEHLLLGLLTEDDGVIPRLLH
jgi:hypothetical protein